VSIIPSDTYPNLQSNDQLLVSTSTDQDNREGSARSCFVVERACGDSDFADDKIRYGQDIYLKVILPGIDQPLYLTSEPKSSLADQKWSDTKYQAVYFSTVRGAKALWYIVFKQEI
jgi:hypothetical protein